MAIIKESSKPGGRDAATTNPPMDPSEGSTQSWCPLPVGSSQSTYPVEETQQMAHHGASIPPPNLSSHASQSPAISHTSSLTSTTRAAANSASNINFRSIQPLPSISASQNFQPLISRANSSPSQPSIPPYPPNLTPRPSELRLHCPAKDRLAQWVPHPDILQKLGTLAAPDLRDRVKSVVIQGWSEQTRASYGAGLLVYHVFCDSRNIPEQERAPANTNLILMFISILSGLYSGRTIHGYIYGVRAWHTVNGLPWALHEDQISTMLKGVTKLAPPNTKQDWQPVTVEIIAAIRRTLTLNEPFDAAFFACLTTVFYSAVRVGEFTLRWLTAFNSAEHITPAHVRDDTDRNGFHTKVFALPRTKSSQNGEEVNWARQSGPTDPLTAFENHLKVNSPPIDGPLFAYKKDRTHRPLTQQTFISHLKKAAKMAGHDDVQGHGIRIGATLEYLLRGIPFDVMNDEAIPMYVEELLLLLTCYVEGAN